MELIDPVVDQRHRSNLQDRQLPAALRLRTHDELWLLDQHWFYGLFNSYLLRYSLTCSNFYYLITKYVSITVYVLLVCFRLHAWLSDTGIGVHVFQ
jgi:hypothetical protein